MKTALISVLVLVILGVGGGLFVFSSRMVGEKWICESCSKTVQDATQNKYLPVWDKSEIVVKNAFCEKCGNEPVTITFGQKCRNCGKLYNSRQQSALRKDRTKGTVEVSGFCSEGCQWRTVTVAQICEWCGTIYRKHDEKVAFDSGKKSEERAAGFCGNACHNRHSAKVTADKAKAVGGEAIKKTGEGLKKFGDWLKNR